VLAPSSHNTQPWLFEVSDGEIRLFADRERWLTVADFDRRELYLSLGAAVENLLVAADHYGLATDVRYLPGADSAHAATVELSEDSNGADAEDTDRVDAEDSNEVDETSEAVERYADPRLFDAIPRRRTNRGRYRDRPIPLADLQSLQDVVVEDDVSLQFAADPETLAAVANLTARADRRLFADPAYRRELARWIGRGAFGDSGLGATVGKYLVSALNVGPRQARKDAGLLRAGPLVAVVRTADDGRRTQIRAGQVFERVSLLATALGIDVHPMSAPLEVPSLRRELAERLGSPEWSVQHLFRLGYAEESAERSPRRPVEAVLVE
jgi:nitroreductase